MPRQARLDAPGLLHHVMIRGIEKRKIFRDEEDYNNLLDRLSTLIPKSTITCCAWVLMPNHAHFLLRSGGSSLASFMRRLLTGYAVSFNKRHKRHGQLFQNRYKSIICQEDIYFKELIRYIHLNPIRGKIASNLKELEAFPYSGHSTLTGSVERAWQETGYVLGNFGKTIGEGRKNYLSYMREGINQGKRPDLTGGGLIRSLGGWREVKSKRAGGPSRIKGDERILGESDFVMDILAQAEEKLRHRERLKRQGYDIKKVAGIVSKKYGVKPSEILSKGRQKNRVEARDFFCFWVVKELGYSITEVARRLEMTPSAIGYAVKRGEEAAKAKKFRLME